jgi:3',5'-cyclic AMP phosphodiesterase CpdA
MAGGQRGFRLAHLSDPHIGPLPPLTPRALLSKRALGYLSWRVRKHRIHRAEVLAALRRDLLASAPDHIAITGDLSMSPCRASSRGSRSGCVNSARPIGSPWFPAITRPMLRSAPKSRWLAGPII